MFILVFFPVWLGDLPLSLPVTYRCFILRLLVSGSFFSVWPAHGKRLCCVSSEGLTTMMVLDLGNGSMKGDERDERVRGEAHVHTTYRERRTTAMGLEEGDLLLIVVGLSWFL